MDDAENYVAIIIIIIIGMIMIINLIMMMRFPVNVNDDYHRNDNDYKE